MPAVRFPSTGPPTSVLEVAAHDGALKLIMCAGTQNVADALTKSLPKPALLSTSIANSCMALHSLSLLSLRAHECHLLQRMSLVCLRKATFFFPKPLVGVSVGECYLPIQGESEVGPGEAYLIG